MISSYAAYTGWNPYNNSEAAFAGYARVSPTAPAAPLLVPGVGAALAFHGWDAVGSPNAMSNVAIAFFGYIMPVAAGGGTTANRSIFLQIDSYGHYLANPNIFDMVAGDSYEIRIAYQPPLIEHIVQVWAVVRLPNETLLTVAGWVLTVGDTVVLLAPSITAQLPAGPSLYTVQCLTDTGDIFTPVLNATIWRN